MKQTTQMITLDTYGPGLTDFTATVAGLVTHAGATTGVLTLMCRHTSASLTIQENADPDVQLDLQAAMGRLAPHDPRLYVHGDEGPDDMPAHIRTVLSGVTLSIPVMDGRLSLGTWQGIYLWEHRDAPHRRTIAAHLLYE
ncbi:MAG: secondary thiamine-phosphate synthase enzyme YjbQ [Pikeienuella sp.]